MLPLLSFALAPVLLLACDPVVDEEALPPSTGPADTSQAAGGALTAEFVPFMIAPAPDADERLAAAIAEAQRTAPEAQRQWRAAPAHLQHLWAVKWAAPTAAGGVENLWVRPARWSAFRIEGVLLSQPQAQLSSGSRKGDLVSFAAEELIDWVRVHDQPDQRAPGETAAFEGGFTVRALRALQ